MVCYVDSDNDEKPRRLTRAEAKARTRRRLLDAAARTFARKGYAGASVEEIAEAAGYSIGALYSNFGGKEELFLELMAGGASKDPAVFDRSQVYSTMRITIAPLVILAGLAIEIIAIFKKPKTA